MEVWQNADGISLGKGKYAVEILKRFGMMDCKAMNTPMASNLNLLSDASSESVDATMNRQMIGSLMFLTDPRHVHLMVAKHAMRYLKGTVEYGLKYEENQKINLEGYVDSNWAGSAIDRKSTLGCSFSMRLGVISWFSRKESCMALSTLKAKYVALAQLIGR